MIEHHILKHHIPELRSLVPELQRGAGPAHDAHALHLDGYSSKGGAVGGGCSGWG